MARRRKTGSVAPKRGRGKKPPGPLIEVRRIHRRDLNKVWEFLKLSFRDVNAETVEYQRPRSKRRREIGRWYSTVSALTARKLTFRNSHAAPMSRLVMWRTLISGPAGFLPRPRLGATEPDLLRRAIASSKQ